jgi:hypothetical protein
VAVLLQLLDFKAILDFESLEYEGCLQPRSIEQPDIHADAELGGIHGNPGEVQIENPFSLCINMISGVLEKKPSHGSPPEV